MSVERKRVADLEDLIIRIVGSMFYGNFKVETPNEREWFPKMKELGFWPETEEGYLELVKKYRM